MAKNSYKKALAKAEENAKKKEKQKIEKELFIGEDGLERYRWFDERSGEMITEPGDWADVTKQNEFSYIGYQRLAMAIIEHACKTKAKSFFFSEWFNTLSPNIDGPSLWKMVEENVEKYGTCYAMKEVIDPRTKKKKLVRYYTPRQSGEREEEDEL